MRALKSHPKPGFEQGGGRLGSMLWATPAEAWDLWKLLQRVALGIRWLSLPLENEEQGLRRGRGEQGGEGAQLSRPARNREGSPQAQEQSLRRECSPGL